MNNRIYITLMSVAVLIILFGSGCEDPITEPPIEVKREAIIEGMVRLHDGTPVAGAEITASSDTQGSFTTTTDADGTYRLVVTLDPDAQTTHYSITAFKQGIGSEVKSLPLASTNDITLNFILGALPGEGSEEGSNIVVVEKSAASIGIKGSGFNETATITFEVRDANGNPVDSLNIVEVAFSLLGGPEGGEFIHPPSAMTDGEGRVKATVNSGTGSGVVQVLAEAVVDTNDFKSSPVLIIIHGGLAHQDHFTISSEKLNFPGYNISGLPLAINVIAGDKNANPVPPETPVSFTTTGGTIQGSAFTDANGAASATLYSGNPRPNHPDLGEGFANVTASTIGENGQKIEDQTIVLFSGRTVITGLQDIFVIEPGEEKSFDYTVNDQHGNPLVEGTTISVTASGDGEDDITLRGDIDVTLPDTQDKDKWTSFSFSVKDNNPEEASNKVLELVIEVDSPNGDGTYTMVGVLAGVDDIPPSGDEDMFKAPHNIVLSSIERPSISVIGTGAPASTVVTFRVLDLLNRPIDLDNQVTVNFELRGPGGGEELNFNQKETDEQGFASTVLTSGTRSGIVQIVASFPVEGRDSVKAEPVKIIIHAGLPTSNNFHLLLEQKNIPYTSSGRSSVVGAQLADKYNNPVQEGTAVYFTTNLGVIQAEAWTDKDGFVETRYWAYDTGNAEITAMTRGEGGESISVSKSILISGSTNIESPDLVDDFLIPPGSSRTFQYTVADENGNPLTNGTTVTVSVEGVGAEDVSLSGDVHVNIPDTQEKDKWTSFSFTIDDNNPDSPVERPIRVRIQVISDNGDEVHETRGKLGGTLEEDELKEPYNIILTGVESESISVTGTGAVNSTRINFIVVDARNKPITSEYALDVSFQLIGPGGGAFLNPTIVETDAQGRASTVLNAGTISGTAQVRATATFNGRNLFAEPVRIVIHAGLPHNNHFAVAPQDQRITWPQLMWVGKEKPIVAVVGDKHSNPVQPGTAVYFRTTAGNIQAEAFTDDKGRVTVDLISIGEKVMNLQDDPGFGYVVAETRGEDGETVIDSVRILLSGFPTLSVTPTTFSIPSGGSETFILTVADQNGNPMAQGQEVRARLILPPLGEGESPPKLSVAPSEPYRLPDTHDPSFTQFEFTVINNETVVSTTFSIEFETTGPNGENKLLITGNATP